MTSPLPVAGSDTRRIPFARTVISLEAREAALYVLESGWVTTGPLVDEFERAFADWIGASHAVAVSSCTDAIELSLRAINLPPLSLLPAMVAAGALDNTQVQYLGFGGIRLAENEGNAHYNSLQASLRTTAWHGVSGQIAYTLSHGYDDMSSSRNNHPEDSNNFQGDWGNADFDTRHNVSGYVTLNTLRTHAKRIFTKLDAKTRAAAVHRARERGLL